MAIRSAIIGALGTLALLAVYVSTLTLVSGWAYMAGQFETFWYFIVSLAVGFGIQAGLYAYLRSVVSRSSGAGGAVAISGGASTAAMVSCCTHYVVNLVPLLGATGIVALASQYQMQFFWIGIVANVFGILYIARAITTFHRKHD